MIFLVFPLFQFLKCFVYFKGFLVLNVYIFFVLLKYDQFPFCVHCYFVNIYTNMTIKIKININLSSKFFIFYLALYIFDNYYIDNFYIDNYFIDNFYVDNFYVDNYYIDYFYIDNVISK